MGFTYGVSDLATRNYAGSSVEEKPAQTPSARPVGESSNSAGGPVQNERSRRAGLLKLMQQNTATVQKIFGESKVTVAGMQGPSPHSAEDRQEVERILADTLERFQKVHNLLYSETRVSGQEGVKRRQRTFKQLCAHLEKIKTLTATLESSADLPNGADEPAATNENAAEAQQGHAEENKPLEERIFYKCLEVIDALTPLCIAVDRPVSTENSVFDHYFQINDNLPLGDQLEDMLVHAALAQTVYADSLGGNIDEASPLLTRTARGSWNPMGSLDHLHLLLKDVCPNLQIAEDGRLIDPDSGLVMQFFENQQTKQATIAFGGTSAGAHKGILVQRLFQNPWITARQWRANLCNATGIAIVGGSPPDSYIKAAVTASLLDQYLKTNRGEDWTLSLTGHSKGAAEAQYAALANRLPAFCFGTPQLGKRVLETLSQEELESGSRNIQHYFVKGDLAPKGGDIVSPVLGRMHGHVGSGYWMEPTPEVGNGMLKTLWCHELFFKSALAEAARQKNPPA